MDTSRSLVFQTPRTQAAPLEACDGPALQEVLERCADYFELVTGLPPGKAEAASTFQVLPEGKGYDDKFLLGVFDRGGDLVGVIDAVRDYPEPGVWMLGLLALVPERRNAGLGTEVFKGFERWAARMGAKHVRIGVASVNRGALAFWRRLGFRLTEAKPMKLGGREDTVFVMMKSVDAPTGDGPAL